MTIRDHLGGRRRIAFIALFVCWLAIAYYGITASKGGNHELPLLVFLPIVGFAGCVLFMVFGLRCPNCKNNLGYTLSAPSMGLGISNKLKYCPYCGVKLDTDMTYLPDNK